MFETESLSALSELEQMPGVGRKIAYELWNLGCRSIQDLENHDPEELYLRLCASNGICMLTDVCFMCFAAPCIMHPTRNMILHC